MQTNKLYYGWFIAAASAFGIGCGIAVIIPAALGLLVAPLHADFGWSSRQIFLAALVNTGCLVVVAPFVGGIVDRFGARRVICLSFAAEALIIASFSQMTGDILGFYARFAALSIFAAGTTTISFAAVIARWFDRRRGLALGIALAGYGLGGALWSLLLRWLIDHVGWRHMYLWQSAIIAGIALPLIFLTIRDTPESLGLQVDGANTGNSPGIKAVVRGKSLKEACADGQYWLMLGTFLLIGSAVTSIIFHIVPLLKARGESSQLAAEAQASLWIVLVVGRISTGWLMDRFFGPRVALAFLTLPIIGISLLASGVTGPAAFAAAILVGLAAGAEADIIAYLVSRYFGLKHYAMIYATYFAIYALGSGVGPAGTAWAVERAGGYGPVLWVLAGLLCIAAVLLVRFRAFPEAYRPAPSIALNQATV
jgi:OFA family oxalate/formate antiporter-like MFS transporter